MKARRACEMLARPALLRPNGRYIKRYGAAGAIRHAQNGMAFKKGGREALCEGCLFIVDSCDHVIVSFWFSRVNRKTCLMPGNNGKLSRRSSRSEIKQPLQEQSPQKHRLKTIVHC